MRHFFTITSCMAFLLPLFLSCSGTAPANEAEVIATSGTGVFNSAVFSDIEGKDWLLSEVISPGNNVNIDRNKYEANFMGAYFSISFREGQVGGIGAPNRYFGPYTLEGSNGLRFGNVASTLMAAFIVPEELTEREYFAYLSGVTRWDLVDGKLRLHGINKDESEAILVFMTKN